MYHLVKTPVLPIVIIFFMSIYYSMGQSVSGLWKTIDDKTGNPVSHVKIKEKDGEFQGTIIKLLPAATVTNCNECEGDRKGKPLVGMKILWDMEPYKDYWSNGTILDPKTGNKYKCSIWLESEDVLKVRGYIGISLFGRTQKWYRVKE